MNYFIYILHCADGTLYTGITTDVARRVLEHNSAGKGGDKSKGVRAAGPGARYTKTRQPVRLAYSEPADPADSRSAALKREHAIKKMSRAQKLSLIAGKI